jgi:Fur family transcriptional regulator, peroxide stress response regulator
MELTPMAGRRVTPQRRLVYETLASTPTHPNAEQLIAMIRRRDPSVSVATVYNTLRLLSDAGRIHELRGLGPKTRYDANVSQHDHFTCRICGAVEDIPPQVGELIRLRGKGLARYQVERVAVHAHGVCATCRSPRHGRRSLIQASTSVDSTPPALPRPPTEDA